MMIRRATEADTEAVEKLYDDIHTAEEMGTLTTGWIRGVYPVRATAEMAVKRKEYWRTMGASGVPGSSMGCRMKATDRPIGSTPPPIRRCVCCIPW